MTDPRPALSLFAAATRALDDAGIPWCRLRASDGREDDLLVDPTVVRRLDRPLAAVGFGRVPHLGHGTHREFHAIDGATGDWAKLDFVGRIDHGPHQEIRTALAPGFLARRRIDHDRADGVGGPGRATLDPDDAFWALLLHELLDRRTPGIRRSDELSVRARDARADGPAAIEVRRLLPPDVSPQRLLDLAGAGDTEALVAIGRTVRRRAGIGAARRRAVGRVLRWIDRHDPPFLRHGLSVVLVESDGAGTSSLVARLDGAWPVPTRSVQLGFHGGTPGGEGRRSLPGIGLLGRLLRMWRGWLVGASHVLRGRLVLFDRHPYDARLTPGGGRRPLGRRLLARALPRPDLVVVLEAPPDVLVAGRPEHPPDRRAAPRAGSRARAGRVSGAVAIDADRPAETVRRDVAALAWARLVERAGAR